MKKAVLDTNVLIDFLRQPKKVTLFKKLVKDKNLKILLPAVVLTELYFKIRRKPRLLAVDESLKIFAEGESETENHGLCPWESILGKVPSGLPRGRN